ncbi:hypothetical protein HELRODRAFT_78293, partial [Helobdella robusta]|uniref:Ig-like domain-containing protein n=1 Tax=Helobdella robusta TaxID=6412 RepID=T1G3A4_HELRO
RFEIFFTGFPAPEIKWYRDDVEIQPSRDFQISQSFQSSQLLIPEVFPEDAGSYSVRALSDTGFAECRAVLKVEGLLFIPRISTVKDSPPEVKNYLQDISVNVNEPVAFDCKIVGHPKPEVTWFKDGQKLPESPRYKTVTDDEGHQTLLIYHITPVDQGVYVCEATNKLGRQSTSAKLTIKGEPRFVKAPSPPSTHTFPKLLQPLQDVTANEGESVQLKCVIVSEPYPVVTWYHNGQPIKPSKYFTMTSEPNGSHVLKLAAVFSEDEGSYKCVARNAKGHVETSGKLFIRC